MLFRAWRPFFLSRLLSSLCDLMKIISVTNFCVLEIHIIWYIFQNTVSRRCSTPFYFKFQHLSKSWILGKDKALFLKEALILYWRWSCRCACAESGSHFPAKVPKVSSGWARKLYEGKHLTSHSLLTSFLLFITRLILDIVSWNLRVFM